MDILEAVRSHVVSTVMSSEARIREYAVIVHHGLLVFKTRHVSSGAGWSEWEPSHGIPESVFLSTGWVPRADAKLTDPVTVPAKPHG